MKFFETLLHGIAIAVVVVTASTLIKKFIALIENSITIDYIKTLHFIRKSFKRGYERVQLTDMNHHPATFKKLNKHFEIKRYFGIYNIYKKEKLDDKEYVSD